MERERKKVSFLPFFPTLLVYLLAPFFTWSLTFVPRSFLRKCTETLAIQAIQAQTQKISTSFKLSNVESLQLSLRVNQHQMQSN